MDNFTWLIYCVSMATLLRHFCFDGSLLEEFWERKDVRVFLEFFDDCVYYELKERASGDDYQTIESFYVHYWLAGEPVFTRLTNSVVGDYYVVKMPTRKHIGSEEDVVRTLRLPFQKQPGIRSRMLHLTLASALEDAIKLFKRNPANQKAMKQCLEAHQQFVAEKGILPSEIARACVDSGLHFYDDQKHGVLGKIPSNIVRIPDGIFAGSYADGCPFEIEKLKQIGRLVVHIGTLSYLLYFPSRRAYIDYAAERRQQVPKEFWWSHPKPDKLPEGALVEVHTYFPLLTHPFLVTGSQQEVEFFWRTYSIGRTYEEAVAKTSQEPIPFLCGRVLKD